MITSPATMTSTDDVFSVMYTNVTQVASFNDSNSTYEGGVNDTGGVASYAGGVPMWQVVLFGTLTAVTSVTTVLGNLVVILSFVIERTLRQPTNFFILSLAVSDLLIGLLSMPLYSIYLLGGKWMLGAFVCDLWLSIDYTVCLASIYTVFCITVDRFCSVRIPAKYRDWRTPNKVIVMVAVTWAVPTVVFFTTIFGWQYFVGERTVLEGSCYVQYLSEFLFSCLLQIGYFWTTLVVMFILYALIYEVALKMSRKADAKQKQASALVSMAGQTVVKVTAITDRTRSGTESSGDPHRGGGGKGEKEGGENRRGRRLRRRTTTEDKSTSGLASDDYGDSSGGAGGGATPEPPLVVISPDTTAPFPARQAVAHGKENKLLVVAAPPTCRSRSSSDSTSYCCDSPTRTGVRGCNSHPPAYNVAVPHHHVTSSRVVYQESRLGGAGATARMRVAAFLACISGEDHSQYMHAEVRVAKQKGPGQPRKGYESEPLARRMPPCCQMDTDDSLHALAGGCYDDNDNDGSPVWRRRSAYRNHNNHGQINHSTASTAPDTDVVFVPQTPRAVFEARRAGRRRARSVGENPLSHHRPDVISTSRDALTDESIERRRGGDIDESIQLLSNKDAAAGTDPSGRAATVAVANGNKTSSSGQPKQKQKGSRKNFLPKLTLRRSSNNGGGGGRGQAKTTPTKATPTKAGARQKSKGEHRALKALRTITIILGAFVLCWTPWHILSLITGYIGYDSSPLSVQKLYDISYWLCYLNSPINPFCYALANQQFKKTFIRIFKLDWHRT